MSINAAVEAIAAQRGVTLKHAYTIYRREQQAATEVPQNQRERVIVALRSMGAVPEGIRVDAQALNDYIIHSLGHKADMHDVTKTLWALQKRNLVKFRVSQKYGLSNIRLTEEGASMSLNGVDRLAPAVLTREEPPKPPSATPDATPDVEHRPETGPLDDFPLIADILQRHARADAYASVVKRLEELGEEDIALTLMDRVTLSPLEKEVAEFISAVEAGQRLG